MKNIDTKTIAFASVCVAFVIVFVFMFFIVA